MSKSLEIMTCSSCGFDNPDNSKKCNKCGITLIEITRGGIFSSDTYKYNYTRRWVCSKCGAKNMSENSKCHSCLGKKSSWF
jgi:ribosomal protein L40E